MKTGVIGCLNTNNIGDYIQTLAVIKLIGKEYKILDRESLNTYNDERIEAANENIANSSRATNFMTPKNKIAKAFRDQVIAL